MTRSPTLSDITSVIISPRADLAWDTYMRLIREGMYHQDSVRGLVLFISVLGGQYVMAMALWHESLKGLNESEEPLHGVLLGARMAHATGDASVVDLDSLCGRRQTVENPIAHGLGVAITSWVNAFSTFTDTPSSTLQYARYQLRPAYQVIFFVVTIFWIWRCLIELSLSIDEFRIFLQPTYKCKVRDAHDESRWTPIREDRSLTTRLVLLACATLKFGLVVAMFMNGYVMLCATTKEMDLILNALALEFVFAMDDFGAKALMSAREMERLESYSFACESCAKMMNWRWGIWLYMLFVLGSTSAFVLSRRSKVTAVYQQCMVLCLTSGVVDVKNINDSLTYFSSDVIFPAAGFCETLLKSFDGETFSCFAWRSRVGEPLTKAFCSHPTSFKESFEVDIDRLAAEVCLSFWFGQGLAAHELVPALRRSANYRPEAFGCRVEDISVTTMQVKWPFFRHPVVMPWLSCRRPAFGPKSGAWNEMPWTIDRFVPAGNFFQNSEKAPVEVQAASCDKLPKVRICGADPCRVVTDEINRTCDQYCNSFELLCSDAFEVASRTDLCRAEQSLSCVQMPTRPLNKLGCRCRLSNESRACGLLPHAYLRCHGDPCKVVVSQWDVKQGKPTNFTSCREYCGLHNFSCVTQLRVRAASCQVDTNPLVEALDCDSDLPNGLDIFAEGETGEAERQEEQEGGESASSKWSRTRMQFQAPDRLCHCGARLAETPPQTQ